MFLDSNRMMFTFLSWLDLLGVALAFRISILKSSNYFQTTDTGLQISQASKNIWKVLQVMGAAVAEWLSSWLAEQEVWGSIPYLAT